MKKNFRKISGVLLFLFMLQNVFGGYLYGVVSADEFVLPTDELNNEVIILPDAADITAPVADLSTLHVSQKTAVPGDTVKIRVKASDDESGIKYVFIRIDNTITKDSIAKSIYQVDEEGYYTIEISINEATHSGEWYIYGISVYDNNSNSSIYVHNSHDLSAGSFEVINEIVDVNPPKIDLSTLHVSQKIAVPGDTVKIRVKASDDESGIKYVFIRIDNTITKNSIAKSIYQVDEEGYYTIEISINEATHSGEWYIYGISVYDNNSNSAIYVHNSHDLSAGSFEVINETVDVNPPKIDLSTLHVSQKTAVPGDTVKVRVKASDDESGIKYVFIRIDNTITKNSIAKSIYQVDEEGYYTIEISINEATHSGEWYIYGISIYDNNNNSAIYVHNRYDLSAGSFEVFPDNVRENLINAQYLTKNATWNYKTIDKDVYVGPNAILTINGDVKINGNLYILGAVVSYGDLTVNSIYARSAYYGSSSTIYQGSMNFKGGSHSISKISVSGQPIPDIPIEVYSDNVVNENRLLPLLEGATLPIGDLYIEGEKIDYYYNGTFSIPNYFVGSKKSLELKVIDIFDKEHIYIYELNNLNQRDLLNIELISPPDKMQYVVGQNLDLTGIEVVGNYDDGSSESIQISEAHISGFNSATPVTGQIVMITVGEKNITFMVDIVEKTLESIEVTKPPTDIVYIVGQEIDISGLEVMGTYNDGSKEVLDITPENISGFDSSAPVAGQIILVTVNGKNTSFTVDIIENSLVSIKITDLPLKLSYYVDDLLEINRLEVTGTYLDGSKAVLEVTETNVSGFNSSSPEMGQILTVSVEGKTDAFSIDILENSLTGIEITSLPEKLDYIEGQPLDLAGLEVSGTYMNGKKAVLEVTEANITGFDNTVVTARQVLTVAVEGKSVDFEISIIEKVLTNVVLQTYPIKKSYYVGEKLRLEGLVLYGTYNDNSSEEIDYSEVSVQGFDSSILVEGQTVTISIGQWKFEFLVDILPEPALKVLAGDNRYRTATRISSETYERADTVILVQANNFPDALAAGPLAYMLNAPILLTSTGRLSGATQEEMERLGAKRVIIMGGESAVSSDVAGMLVSDGYQVERLEGSNRYSTSVVTAEFMEAKLGIRSTVVLASGTQFADALAAGSYAASEGYPIVLTDGNRLTKTTMDHIVKSGVDRIIIVGGTTVISETLENELRDKGIIVTRKSGKNRFDTSLEIARSFFGNAETAVVANGMEFADALAAAPYAAKMGAPILLVNQSRINLPIKEYLPGSMIDSIVVVGGEAAVGTAVRSELEELVR